MKTNPVMKEAAQSELIPLDELRSIAESLKCMAHPHRLRIIEILANGEQTVENIASLCQLSQPATSGHLRLMEGKGLLRSERRGRMVFYEVANIHSVEIIESFRVHLPR